MEKLRIAAIVVTYNRIGLLLGCLRAIEAQTLRPDVVYIIDNASSDGTDVTIEKEGLADGVKNGIRYEYIRLEKNLGGAGGFYMGMKLAHETKKYGALWVMDDDGMPDTNCLKELSHYLDSYDYLSPMVLDNQNDDIMAFEGGGVQDFKKRQENGIVKGCANPFNGILYSMKLIDTVGYPKKELFIWGDEVNYDLRCKAHGFQPIMVCSAIHRHPLNRQMTVRYLGQRTMTVSDKEWKLFCYIRNRTYNARQFRGGISCMSQMLMDMIKFGCYYILQVKQPQKLKLVCKAMLKGFRGDFTGLEEYLK